ncbi:MAG: hypothetical protein CVU90_06860 [Firmicutes bacterium HGW-Firmicutes-15]|nr:MAG: hypothetical protein CVU90_06860 [Firmicutes bacterium HGW-Firmicutes-15]
MIKARSKKISLLLVLMMLATMFVGIGTVSAASTITCNNPLQVGTDGNRTLGTVRVDVDMTQLNNGDEITFRLPADFKWFTKQAATDFSGAGNAVNADQILQAGGAPKVATQTVLEAAVVGTGVAVGDDFIVLDFPVPDNGLSPILTAANNPLSITVISDREFKLTYDATVADTTEANGYFYMKLLSAYVPSGASTEVQLFVEKQPSSGFPAVSSVTVATTSAGDSTATIDSLKSITGNGTLDVIRIKENRAAAMDACNLTVNNSYQTITVKLPTGMEWNAATTVTGDWGLSAYTFPAFDTTFANLAAGATSVAYGYDATDKQKLLISVTDATATAGILKITPVIDISETDAKVGDITVTFGGKETVTNGTLVIGQYVDFGVVVEAGTVKTVKAGSNDSEAGYFFVKENGPGSLLNGRSLTLTLSGDAKWDATQPVVSYEKGDATLGAWATVGTDNRTIKALVTSGTTTTTIKFKTPKVVIAPDAVAGDLNVEVGGTAGAAGTIKIADIVPRVTGTISSSSDVRIGLQNQLLGDILIKEGAKEALRKANFLVKLPEGMSFSAVPTVEVTEGDISLDTAAIKLVSDTNTNDSVLITVKSTSSAASTIKLSAVKINVNRVVPEGPFKIELKSDGVAGAACALFTAGSVAANYWPNTVKAVSISGGEVVTPAPGEVTNSCAFVVGAATYTVNGNTVDAFAASYIKDSRTYLAIRDIANAVGIDQANVIWDGSKNTVTLMKGDKVVQMTIASKTLLINGAPVTMDVAPEIGPGNRTMLPAAFVAMSFGATASFDAVTNTVTIK